MADGPAVRPAATLLGLLLFATYGYFVATPAWNENSRFDLVRSIVERQRLDIDPFEHNTGDKSTVGGHVYSDKAPGTALLATPVYAAYHAFLRLTGGSMPASIAAAGQRGQGDLDLDYLVNPAFRRALYVCNLFTNALAGALLGALFFTTLRKQPGVLAGRAFTATLALAVGSMVFPYATMFYGHVMTALFLFGGAQLLAGVKEKDEGPAAPGQDVRRLAAAGALAGLAVLTELPSAPAAALLGGYAVWRTRPRIARSLWYAAGLAVPVLALLAYQRAAFGSALKPGYALVTRPEFAEGMSRGLLGVELPRPRVLGALLFGRARGLLYVSPVLVLGFVGLGRRLAEVWREPRMRVEAALPVAIVLYFLLMNAGYYMWYGGSALGPRHLIPALPFLCLGIPFAVRRRPGSLLLGALLAISVANVLAATAVEPSAPMVADVLRDHVYAHLLRGEVPLPSGPGNLGAMLGLRGLATLLPLLALWGLALPVLIPLVAPGAPKAEARSIIAPAEQGGADRPAPRA